MRNIWPNFFIVGAARSGTTSLYEYLNAIPSIYMSPIKEPYYFVDDVGPDLRHLPHCREEQRYLSLFKAVKSEASIGEASSIYLWDRQAPIRIYQIVPDAKIIIMLRDPIERAYSNFLLFLRSGYETTLDFLDAVKDDYFRKNKKGFGYSKLYVELGMYSEQVKRYLETFETKNVKLVIFEDEFKSNTRKAVQDIVEFLGLSYEVPENLVNRKYNDSNSFSLPRTRKTWAITRWVDTLRKDNVAILNLTRPIIHSLGENLLRKPSKRPPLTKEAVSFLRQIFSEDVHSLSKLLSVEPTWIRNY